LRKKKSNRFFPQRIQVSPPSNKFAPGKVGYYDKKPIFSFSYYFDGNNDWSFRCVRNCSDFHTLFRNLYNMSQLTWGKIISATQFHAHEINDISRLAPCVQDHFRKRGILELSPFQFKAFDEKSRIIGVFTHNSVFEIICIDIGHQTYS